MKKIFLSFICAALLAGCGGVGGEPLNEEQSLIAQQAILGVITASGTAEDMPDIQSRATESGSIGISGAELDYRMTTSNIGDTSKVRMVITADFDQTYSTNVDIKYGDNALARSGSVSLTGKIKTDVSMKASGSFDSLENLGVSTSWDLKFYNPNLDGIRLTVKDGSETIFDQKVTFRFTSSYKMGASVADGIEGKAEVFAKINGEELADGGLMVDFTW